MNLYNILALDKSASQREIKTAYRKLAQIHHPDKFGGDQEKFNQINAAYQILGNPVKRRHYDETGLTEPANPIEKEAEQVLLKWLNDILEKNIFLQKNIIEVLKNNVDKQKQSDSVLKQQQKEKISHLKQLLRRVKCEDEDNLVQGMAQQKISFCEINLKNIEERQKIIEVIERRINTLSDDFSVSLTGLSTGATSGVQFIVLGDE